MCRYIPTKYVQLLGSCEQQLTLPVYIYIFIYLLTLYIMTISIGQVPGTLQLYSPTFGLNLAECWSMLNQEPGT